MELHDVETTLLDRNIEYEFSAMRQIVTVELGDGGFIYSRPDRNDWGIVRRHPPFFANVSTVTQLNTAMCLYYEKNQ